MDIAFWNIHWFTKMLLITKLVFVGNQDIKLNYLPGAKYANYGGSDKILVEMSN